MRRPPPPGTGDRPAHHNLPHLLDLHAVAARLALSERHVRRLVSERKIPYMKVGHLLRFDPTEIADWLDASRVPVHSPGWKPMLLEPDRPRRAAANR